MGTAIASTSFRLLDSLTSKRDDGGLNDEKGRDVATITIDS